MPSSSTAVVVEDPAAELAALQQSYDEYVQSSREIEMELESELESLQQSLEESSAANALLASQLRDVSPQLHSLEESLGTTRTKLEREISQRRQAEQLQDEAESRARGAEGTSSALKEENDALHEELAFRGSEIDELRGELEELAERYREEMEALKADLHVARQRGTLSPVTSGASNEHHKGGGRRGSGSGSGASTAAMNGAAALLAAVTEEDEDGTIVSPLRPRRMEEDDGDDDQQTPFSSSPPSREQKQSSSEKPSEEDQSSPPPLTGGTTTTTTIGRSLSADDTSVSTDAILHEAEESATYIKSLEDELELVTEQLIESQSHKTSTEGQLTELHQLKTKLEQDLSDVEEQLREALGEIEEATLAATTSAEAASKVPQLVSEVESLREELELTNEELSLTRDAMDNLEDNVKRLTTEKMEDAKKFQEELETVRRGAGGLALEVADGKKRYEEEMESLRQQLDEARAQLEERSLLAVTKRNDDTNDEIRRLEEQLHEARREGKESAKRWSANHLEEQKSLEDRLSSVERTLRQTSEERDRLILELEKMTTEWEKERIRGKGWEVLLEEEKMRHAREDVAEVGGDGKEDKTTSTTTASENQQLLLLREKLDNAEMRVEELTRSNMDLRKELAEWKLDDDGGEGEGAVGGDAVTASSTSVSSSPRPPPPSGLQMNGHHHHAAGTTTRSSGSNSSELTALEEKSAGQQRRIVELEEEITVLREKLRQQQQQRRSSSSPASAALDPGITPGTPPPPPPVFSPASREHENTALLMDLGDEQQIGGGDGTLEEVLENGDESSLRQHLRTLTVKSQLQREHNAQLLQRILSLRGNIQVCCRVRPLNTDELTHYVEGSVEPMSETEVTCLDARSKVWKSFAFDKVWGPDQMQHEVFQDVEPLALSVVDGFNACIFAYGQTGSGKTYTMEGSSDYNQYGISQRTVQKVFQLLALRERKGRSLPHSPSRRRIRMDDDDDDQTDFHFTIHVGMFEIYNDEVFDLLSPDPDTRGMGRKPHLEARQDVDGRVVLPALTKEPVKSLADVMALLKRGNSTRATASTNLNEHSSRSHMILNVQVTTSSAGQKTNGQLYLVDLAGSERVRNSGVHGKELKEAQHINKSLSALGDVMEALDRKAPHVPYRNSKLTYLLQDCLGGNSRTMMVVTVNPGSDCSNETLYALQFATRVRRINIGAAKRNVASKNYEEVIKRLTEENRAATRAKERCEEHLQSMKREQQQLNDRLATYKQARTKSHNDVRSIAVMRKAQSDLTARYQREKELCEKKADELEKIQFELRKSQQQLLNANKERDHAKKLFDEKEKEVFDVTMELRTTKDELSAANLRNRRSQIMQTSPRKKPASGSPAPEPVATSTPRSKLPPSATAETPSPTRRSRIPMANTASSAAKRAQTTAITPRKSHASTTPSSNVRGAAPMTGEVANIRGRILLLFERYDPPKVKKIDAIMDRFRGRESILLDRVVSRYEGDTHSDSHSVISAMDDDNGSVTSQGSVSARTRAEIAIAKHKERMKNRRTLRKTVG